MKSVLCDDLQGWDGGEAGGRSKRDRYVCVRLIHFTAEQKLTQHCKLVILQNKQNRRKDKGDVVFTQWNTTQPQKNEILSFATTCMDPDIIILSEVKSNII